MRFNQKTMVYCVLLSYCGNAFAACEDLRRQRDNYETACQVSTGLTVGCGALTAATTALLGPFGLLCSVPTLVASGVCAMRDLKKKWYQDCLKGRGEPWQKLVLSVDPKYLPQAQARLEKMIDNNKKYEQDVDTFIQGCSERGVDVTSEENFAWFKEMLGMFEDEYIARAKEIDLEYQESIR